MYFPRTLLTGREPSETVGLHIQIVGGLSACILDLVSTTSAASSWSSASSLAGRRPPRPRRPASPGQRPTSGCAAIGRKAGRVSTTVLAAPTTVPLGSIQRLRQRS